MKLKLPRSKPNPKLKPKSASNSAAANMNQRVEKELTKSMRHGKQKKQTKARRYLVPKNGIYNNQFMEQSEPNNNQNWGNNHSSGYYNPSNRHGYDNGHENTPNNAYNEPTIFQTMKGPMVLYGQEARNANTGILPRNYEEEYRQHKLREEYERQHDPEFLRHLQLEQQRQEYQRQHDPEYQHQLQLERQKQRRREYRQRLRQKRQQEAEINNNNNNFEDNSTDFGSIRAERSSKAKNKKSGLELERL